jgi:hypothetical protein
LTNPYCEALRIRIPVLDEVKDHPEASAYSLLIVALLERGWPLTLAEVAERFARAGVAPYDAALRSLQRCRPARAPVYRDGDRYALDPHDHDVDLWAFRLGLRPPRVASRPPAPAVPPPLPGPEVPLTVAELDEVWRDANLYGWSAQRVALCVLDAHREPLTPAEIVAFVSARTKWHLLSEGSAKYWRRGAPIRPLEEGGWAVEPGHPALRPARQALRDRLTLLRRWAALRPDPAAVKDLMRAAEERRAAHGAELARLRRVLAHAFPSEAPRAVVLVDVAARELTTYTADDLPQVRKRLDDFDVIIAVEVRPLLRALQYDPGGRRLAELGPPQKSTKLNRRGRTLKITTALLVWGSCGIGRPFGDEERLRRYLATGQTAKLHRRLEADAKALFALYEYGRLHGAVRLRWGFLDETIPAPWVHRDETRLYGLVRDARDLDAELEVVIGSAPGWKDPWARARRCRAVSDGTTYGVQLVDEEGAVIADRDVQLARLVTRVH